MTLNNKKLIFISTHVINKAVISEYKKLQNIDGYDTLLCIDNSNLNFQSNKRICDLIFFNTNVKCFLFDKSIHEDLNLPNYYFDHITDNFSEIMWYNADYRFYYVKEYFPDYAYYWQIDYDVFCNGNSYQDFLSQNETNEDLLIPHLRPEKLNGEWYWTQGIDFIYKNTLIYGSFFPICRLSNNAIEFLKNRRIEHCKIYDSVKNKKNTKWLNCELFVPTELIDNRFSARTLNNMENVGLNEYDLNENRLFENPDNKLYHPIKGNFLSRLYEINYKKISNYWIYINFLGLKISMRKH